MEIKESEYTYECIHCGFTSDTEFEYCPACKKNDAGSQLEKKTFITELAKGRTSQTMFLGVGIMLNILMSLLLFFKDNTNSILLSTIIYIVLIILFSFLLIIGVRRMHDINLTGWYSIIPIFNFIMFLKRGNSIQNKYGPVPIELFKINFLSKILLSAWIAFYFLAIIFQLVKFIDFEITKVVGIYLYIIIFIILNFFWRIDKNEKNQAN